MVTAGKWVDERGVVREGITLAEAESTAQQMLYRDRPGSGDDRRVCFECKHLDGRVCKAAGSGRMVGVRKGMEPVRIVLQRCNGFELRAA